MIAEVRFWDCVRKGELPVTVPIPAAAKPVGFREICFEGNNAWAAAAADWRECREAARGNDEVDAGANRPKVSTEQSDPDQGWEQWARDIEDMIRLCESGEAIDRVQNTYRGMLRAASKRRPELYDAIGAAVQARRLALKPAANRHVDQPPAAKSRAKRAAANEILVDA